MEENKTAQKVENNVQDGSKNVSKLEGALQNLTAGTQIIKEDEISRKMYIIKTGRARVYKTYLGQKVTLAVLGPGEVFGELSFFDAEPRSASVEALSDLAVVVIDGDVMSAQLESLPSWIVPIVKSVFHRFRELDEQTMVLQHVYEFQKKHHKTDGLAQNIYIELQRYLKTIMLLYSNELKANGSVKSDVLRQEMQDVLGESVISVKSFWKVLKRHDFIDAHKEESEGLITLRTESIKIFQDYLGHQADDENYMLLSVTAVNILRKIAGHLHGASPDAEKLDTEVKLNAHKMQLNAISLKDEALKELKDVGILSYNEDQSEITVRPNLIFRIFTYQSVLKCFDHSSLVFE